MAEFTRTIAVAVDGSENALKSLDYLSLLYGPEHKVVVTLIYVLPALPTILVADPNRQTRSKVLNIEKKGIRFAEDILVSAPPKPLTKARKKKKKGIPGKERAEEGIKFRRLRQEREILEDEEEY